MISGFNKWKTQRRPRCLINTETRTTSTEFNPDNRRNNNFGSIQSGKCLSFRNIHGLSDNVISIYLSSINHEPSILTMRRDGQKRKIIRKMCI